jgi:hypothetical protein
MKGTWSTHWEIKRAYEIVIVKLIGADHSEGLAIRLGQDRDQWVSGSCDHGNEHPISIKGSLFIDYLSEFHLCKENFAALC